MCSSKPCQKAHWKVHKADCNMPEAVVSDGRSPSGFGAEHTHKLLDNLLKSLPATLLHALLASGLAVTDAVVWADSEATPVRLDVLSIAAAHERLCKREEQMRETCCVAP